MAVPKHPTDLEIAEPFSSLFPISPGVLQTLTHRMRAGGYDAHHPILAWRDAFGQHGRTVIVDGHTRRQAAIDAGVDQVMVTVRRFDNAEAAIAEAIEEQAHRRNLNSAQLAVYVLEALTRLDDGTRGQGSRNDLYGRSARQLADMLGVGTSTIERARKLIDLGDSELLAEVKRGDISLKAAVERGKRSDDIAPIPEPAPEPRLPRGSEIPTEDVRGAWLDLDNSPSPEIVEAAKDLLVRALGHEKFEQSVAEREETARRDVERRSQAYELEDEDEPADPESEPIAEHETPPPSESTLRREGGWSDIAYVLWDAVEELRDFNRQTTKGGQAIRLAYHLTGTLDYFGVNPDDDDDTVQDWIWQTAWDDNQPPRPAPWDVTA